MRLLERLALLGGITLAITACGKKGALVYPDMLVPAAPTAVSAIQSGAAVKIQFDVPTSDRAGSRLNNLAGLKISKREAYSTSVQTCRSCTEDYRLFRKLYLDLLPDFAQRFGNRLIVLDGDVSAGRQYTYVIVPFTKEGVDGASSSQALVQLVTALPPPSLLVESHPTEIKLSFAVQSPVEGILIGYNLYRTLQNSSFPLQPVNRAPFLGNEYVDSGLARGTVYRYLARAVVRLPSGVVVESLVSNEVEGMLKDDE